LEADYCDAMPDRCPSKNKKHCLLDITERH